MALFNSVDLNTPAPFWQNGPAPGAFYHFPGGSSQSGVGGFQRSQAPMTTGTSVIGIQFKTGVVIAADVLGSYGSLARFRSLNRIIKVNNNILLGAGGDYADYQYIKSNIERKIIEESCLYDISQLKPKALHYWLTRIMYNARSSFDPFWNNFVIAGMEDDEPYLGTVDKLGTAYSDPVIATGYGAYMATPVIRKAYEENDIVNEKDAIDLATKMIRILFYRDARAFQKYQIGIIKKGETIPSTEIIGPSELTTNWEPAIM